MPVSEKTFRQLALEDPGQWELHHGVLSRKPNMTAEHNNVATALLLQLGPQLDKNRYRLRLNLGHVRRSVDSYYIPDVYVIPIEQLRTQLGTRKLEVYAEPLPLVVEVWSASTGEYDVDSKLPEYQQRGDLEIWRIHPYERTLTTWRRLSDGNYEQSQYQGGNIRPLALPGVVVDLDTLFD